MSTALTDRLLTIRAGLKQRDRDPLRFWHFAVPRLKQALALFVGDDPIEELLARGPNGTGKTESLCAFVVECCKKGRSLDGLSLPQWRGAVEALCCVLDYKQQLLSVQPAYLRVLGEWPHTMTRVGEALATLRIMPHGGDPDDDSGWSVIHFLSQENRRTGVGARADIVHFDEPPMMEILRELRKSAHAGRRSIRIIGMTPTQRRQWAPIRQDYGDCPRRKLRRVDTERAEVRWSLHETAPWLIPDVAKEALRRKYLTDPLAQAREHGDYENTEGKCPFDAATLTIMADTWCTAPELSRIPVVIESADGEPKSTETVSVEVWTPPRRGLECYQAIDPASGIDDNAHNPAGLQLHDEATGDLLVRWNGYLAPYSVGAMAASLHRHYAKAATDIEMKDHWGVNVVRGFEDQGGTNLCFERRELRPDVWGKEVGFDVTAETRAIWIGCIQEWIAAFKAGTPYAICRSRAVFDCLLDMELDDRDRPVAGPGIAHGEDMVLLGQRLRRLVRPRHADPKVWTGPTQAEKEMRALFGEEPRGRSGGRRLRPSSRRPA